MAISGQDFKDKAARRRKVTDAEIPEIGIVRLRALSAGDVVQFQAEVKKASSNGGNPEALAFSLVARSWIDENGELLFPEEEGIAFAQSLDVETYKVLAQEVLKLNGLSETAIEEAENFSAAGRNESSPTDSPRNLVSPTLT
jgi:hypothetical protein